MACDLYDTPALGGQHGIRYDPVDLAGDLGLLLDGDLNPALADDSVLRMAEEAYLAAAGEAFWAEAGRIAADRAAQHEQPAPQGMKPDGQKPGHPGPHREN